MVEKSTIHPIPIVLKEGKHVPLADNEYMAPTVNVNSPVILGDGSQKSPLQVSIGINLPYINPLQLTNKGLFCVLGQCVEHPLVCDFEKNITYSKNGYGYFSYTFNYQNWVTKLNFEPNFTGFSWLCQSLFYSSQNIDYFIPFSLVAHDWQKSKHEMTFHFVLYQKPVSVVHLLPHGKTTSPMELNFIVQFYYYPEHIHE
ncbi:hypothetical protein [Xenorhabdus bharatensis]|uniref:hypothetical protein n=1 Tax=Xenorhabdus bharatensis TaxID=3136256 RepID=UPI0030F3CD0D